MKKIILVGALCLALTGCGKPTAPPEEEEITARAVEVISLENSDISSQYIYSGKIKPSQEAHVFSTIAGKVASVKHEIGDSVKAGEVLFQMDTQDIQNNLNVLRTSIATADANIASAKTALDTVNGATMQSQIENAKAALANAELAYNNAKTNYENNKVLFDSGIISQTDMDKIQMAYDNATVTYNQAQESYNLVANEMPQENERKAQDAYNIAVASRASAAAQIASAEKSLRDATVTSPINGIITAKNVVAGTVLSQSQPAYTVIDMNTVEIDVGVSEQVINSLQPGQEVDVKVSSISQDKFIGVINTVNPAASDSGTYEVKIRIDNSDNLFKVGMLGEVYFTKEAAENTIVIPRSCVITKNDETYVFTEENGVAKQVIVATGIDDGENIEITDGLSVGMNVISKGQTYLADGDPVKPVDNSANDGQALPNTTAEPSTNTKEENTENSDSIPAAENAPKEE